MSEVFFSPINIKGPDISAAIGISNISPKIASPVSKGISMPSFRGLGGLVSDI